MIDQNALNAATENYLDRVDEQIQAYGVTDKRGTELLDPVQVEVDGTLEKVTLARDTTTISAARMEFNQSVERISAMLSHITRQSLGSIGKHYRGNFGNLTPARSSLHDNKAWSAAVSKVTNAVAGLTSRYQMVFSNMDSNRRAQYDKNLATIINYGNEKFMQDATSPAAQGYTSWAMGELSKVEKELATIYQANTAQMLKILVDEKDAERLGIMSQLKVSEKTLTPQQNSVANMHNEKASSLLTQILHDGSSYDGSIRDRKFALVDKHLNVMRQLMQGVQFETNLGGGMFTTTKNVSRIHANHARTRVPIRPYNQSRPPPNTRIGKLSGFRDASDAYSGGALGTTGSTLLSQLETLEDGSPPNQSVILNTLSANVASAKSQGSLTPADQNTLRQQIRLLTVEAFDGDHQEYNRAIQTYTNTLEELKSNYSSLSGVLSYDNPVRTQPPVVRIPATMGLVLGTLAIPAIYMMTR